MKNNKNDSDRFSLRKSVLIWTAGIFLGWGAAFVIVYKLIESSVSGGGDQQTHMAAIKKPVQVEDIEPAAGPQSKP